MFRSRQAICAFLLVLAGALLPETGYCVEEDLYVYRLLFGGVQFGFERQTQDYGTREVVRDTFRQGYYLDTLGNIINRYMATYDAGVRLTKTSSESGNFEAESQGFDYYLKTSILPRSAIPLTLHFSQYFSESEFGGSGSSSSIENESTRYGLHWEMKFRDLPKTSIFAETSETSGQGSSTTSSIYRLDMEKKIGPSDNSLFYNLNTTDSSSGSSTFTSGINIRNRTKLSRATSMNFGFSAGSSESESSAGTNTTEVQGLAVGLVSSPGVEFDQSHNYSYFSSKIDASETSGQVYSGSMGYRFSERLAGSTSLAVSETTGKSPTGETSNESFGYGLNVSYAVNDNISLFQAVNYGSSEDSAGNKSTSYGTNTGINYRKLLDWAAFSSGYGLGYTHQEVNANKPFTGLQQSVNASLSNIDVNKYVLFSTGFSFSDSSDSNGSWNRSTSYSLSAANKEWTEFVTMQGGYSRTNSTSKIDIYNTSSQNLRFSATSDYFRNTNFAFVSTYNQREDEAIGTSTQQTQTFSANHNRPFYDGNLRLGYQYSRNNSDFKGGDETNISSTIIASYNRKILGNVDWDSSLSRSKTEVDSSFYATTHLTNTFRFGLRAWFVSLEHRYTLIEDSLREQVDNTYFVFIQRNFVRYLNF